jgi:hypothetical protein
MPAHDPRAELMATAEELEEAFRRGAAAGEVQERLATHDRHFGTINGQLSAIAGRMSDLVLNVQRLADQQGARAEREAMVTQALKDATAAEMARRDRAWTPWSKALALIGGLVGVAALALSLYLGLTHKAG